MKNILNVNKILINYLISSGVGIDFRFSYELNPQIIFFIGKF